jgi:hypothetical protein|nr:MAG TPA: hypothetical protein [Caudoviricetes sp.]
MAENNSKLNPLTEEALVNYIVEHEKVPYSWSSSKPQNTFKELDAAQAPVGAALAQEYIDQANSINNTHQEALNRAKLQDDIDTSETALQLLNRKDEIRKEYDNSISSKIPGALKVLLPFLGVGDIAYQQDLARVDNQLNELSKQKEQKDLNYTARMMLATGANPFDEQRAANLQKQFMEQRETISSSVSTPNTADLLTDVYRARQKAIGRGSGGGGTKVAEAWQPHYNIYNDSNRQRIDLASQFNGGEYATQPKFVAAKAAANAGEEALKVGDPVVLKESWTVANKEADEGFKEIRNNLSKAGQRLFDAAINGNGVLNQQNKPIASDYFLETANESVPFEESASLEGRILRDARLSYQGRVISEFNKLPDNVRSTVADVFAQQNKRAFNSESPTDVLMADMLIRNNAGGFSKDIQNAYLNQINFDKIYEESVNAASSKNKFTEGIEQEFVDFTINRLGEVAEKGRPDLGRLLNGVSLYKQEAINRGLKNPLTDLQALKLLADKYVKSKIITPQTYAIVNEALESPEVTNMFIDSKQKQYVWGSYGIKSLTAVNDLPTMASNINQFRNRQIASIRNINNRSTSNGKRE